MSQVCLSHCFPKIASCKGIRGNALGRQRMSQGLLCLVVLINMLIAFDAMRL